MNGPKARRAASEAAAVILLCLLAGCASAPPSPHPAPTPAPITSAPVPLPEPEPVAAPAEGEEVEVTYCYIPGFGGDPGAVIAADLRVCGEIEEELAEAAPPDTPRTERARILTKDEAASLLGPALQAPGPPPNVYIFYFDLNSSEPKQTSLALLGLVVRDIRGRTAPRVMIDGHTDTKGDRTYNDQLSLRRAQAVAALLAARGIDSSGFTVRSHGKSSLLIPTGDQADEPRNRRVEVTIR